MLSTKKLLLYRIIERGMPDRAPHVGRQIINNNCSIQRRVVLELSSWYCKHPKKRSTR